MGNMCSSCNRMTGLESQDPEFPSGLDLSYSDGAFTVSGDLRHVRQCSECGHERKEISESCDDSVKLDQFDGWKDLSETDRERVKAALDCGEFEGELTEGDLSCDESGGGRYKKNLITCRGEYSIEIDGSIPIANPVDEHTTERQIKLVYNGMLSMENAASSYDEN